MQSTLGQVQWASAPTKSGSNSNKNKNNNNSAQQSETKAKRQKRGGKKKLWYSIVNLKSIMKNVRWVLLYFVRHKVHNLLLHVALFLSLKHSFRKIFPYLPLFSFATIQEAAASPHIDLSHEINTYYVFLHSPKLFVLQYVDFWIYKCVFSLFFLCTLHE